MSTHQHPESGSFVDLSQLDLPGYEGEVQARYASPAFQQWLRELPAQLNGQDADLIYRQRNRIYRIDDPLDPQGPGICVKAFRSLSPLRDRYYRHIGSKARRAHLYSRLLHERGAGVAEPIGYIERWEGKRLKESYLLTRYLDDATDLYTEMVHLLREDPSAERFVDLMRFSARAVRVMHDSGFVHNDLGAQNILMRRVGPGEWCDPVFIDLNRGRPLEPVDTKTRARDMSRLEIPSHFLQIFYHMYFNDGPIPDDFARWERRYRARIRRHRASRKWRHPLRTLRELFRRSRSITISAGRPADRNLWLWDEKSGQPSVMLQARDRNQYRKRSDLFKTLWANLRTGWRVRREYRALKAQAYTRPVAMQGRLGVCLEVDEHLEQQLVLLQQTPGLPVLVRVYLHKGEAGLADCAAAIQHLAAAGHPVTLAVVQSRQAVLEPTLWQDFVANALALTHKNIKAVEIGHAVNRVKWGFWNLEEILSIWQSVAALRQQYPGLQFLGPAVNDFEFQYYPPLLEKLHPHIDGLSCHLYLDRRGAPENYQGAFSALEKCLYGKALANVYGQRGFYITETNWPLKNSGDYSPLAGCYIPKDKTESPLHVDEATSAAYMLRYALIAFCSGAADALWWWRLSHPGFGLVDDRNGFEPRAGWRTLVQFHRRLGGETFVSREERDGVIWWSFQALRVAYALADVECQVPEGVVSVEDMEGQVLAYRAGDRFMLGGELVYFLWASEGHSAN